jgi:hypothetical protein
LFGAATNLFDGDAVMQDLAQDVGGQEAFGVHTLLFCPADE